MAMSVSIRWGSKPERKLEARSKPGGGRVWFCGAACLLFPLHVKAALERGAGTHARVVPKTRPQEKILPRKRKIHAAGEGLEYFRVIGLVDEHISCRVEMFIAVRMKVNSLLGCLENQPRRRRFVRKRK